MARNKQHTTSASSDTMSKDTDILTTNAASSQHTDPSSPNSDAESDLEIPGIDPEQTGIDEVKDRARTLLFRGCNDFEDLIEGLCDTYELEGDAIPGITSLSESVLQKLISEQSQWPGDEMADMNMLEEAFEILEHKGIISRANFSCCSRCGNGEIRGEALSHHIGYCYFHEQDLDSCIEFGGLVLRHGAIGDDYADDMRIVEIGNIIVDTMKDVGLKTVWNEDPGIVIELPEFKWRVRLHDSTHEDGEQQEGNGEGKKEQEWNVGDRETDFGFPLRYVYIR